MDLTYTTMHVSYIKGSDLQSHLTNAKGNTFLDLTLCDRGKVQQSYKV
jgi:hypothetical protein